MLSKSANIKAITLVLITCLLFNIFPMLAFAETPKQLQSLQANTSQVSVVVLNNKLLTFDVEPIIENNRTLVPLRAIFEAIGAYVNWDELTQTVTATKGSNQITLKIGEEIANKNGSTVQLDVPAKIVCDRTLVPLRFVSEALGANVGWDDSSQTVTIELDSQQPTGDINPIAYKEVRYLPASDEVYVRADLNPVIGQKAESEWPIVWIGIYDLNENKWLYDKIDPYNRKFNVEMKHVKFNTYEKYIPVSCLHRNENLKFVFFVDRISTPEIAEQNKVEIILTPIPKQTWDVKYNLTTDELEAVANPDVSSVASVPDLYLVVFDDDGTERYGFHDYTETLTQLEWVNGKFIRSWKAPDSPLYESGRKLNLPRDKTYYCAVVARGFENQIKDIMNLGKFDELKGSYFKKIVVDKPRISSWDIQPNSSTKTITVNAKTVGIPGTYSLKLINENNDFSINIPVVTSNNYSSERNYMFQFAFDKLGLDYNKEYKFHIEVFNELEKFVCKSPESKNIKLSLQPYQKDFIIEPPVRNI